MRAHVKHEHEEAKEIMKDLKRMLVIAVMLCVPSISAFAQEQKPPKPPPPDIVEKPKEKPPPDNRDNGQKKGGDEKKGKP
jgi:membrane protein involved in colicin uptake